MEEEEEILFRIFRMKAGIEILRFVAEHGTAQYKQLQQFVSVHTLNARLRDLRNLNLIKHRFIREEIRKEWYEPTEKGMKIVKCLDELEKILQE